MTGAFAFTNSAERHRNSMLMALADTCHVYAMGQVVVAACEHGTEAFDARYHYERAIALANVLDGFALREN